MNVFNEDQGRSIDERMESFLKELPDNPDKDFPSRHVKLASARSISGLRRSIFKAGVLFCFIKEPLAGQIHPDLTKCIFRVDKLIIDKNGDLIGRLTPMGNYHIEGKRLLNSDDFFKMVSIKTHRVTIENWTKLDSLYLTLK